MKFRKLRIAWSVSCGLTTVLLIALWVRSYSSWDGIGGTVVYPRVIQVWSGGGRVVFSLFAANQRPWTIGHSTREEVRKSSEGRGVTPDPRHFGFTEYGFKVPHWFIVLLFAVSAVIPWLHQLPSRFSLRTLLIATTLVAVVLGTIMLLSR